MKFHEYTPDNTENTGQPTNERNPWESLTEVPFAGDLGGDEYLKHIRETMVSDETATAEEQQVMKKAQEEADRRNETSKAPEGKDFENYVESILNGEK